MEYFAYSQKAFLYKYVVMLSDADQFKHMSFANYLKLMFLATDALLVKYLNANFLEMYRLKLNDSRMQFKKQTIPGDNVLIKINAANVAENQFVLLYTFVMEGSAELVALGRQTYSILEIKTNQTIVIPETMKSLLDPISIDEENMIYSY